MDTLKLYLRGAAGAIVVADLTLAAFFDRAARGIEQIRGDEIGRKIPIALAANKSDLPSRPRRGRPRGRGEGLADTAARRRLANMSCPRAGASAPPPEAPLSTELGDPSLPRC